jgi:hypothetical protein
MKFPIYWKHKNVCSKPPTSNRDISWDIMMIVGYPVVSSNSLKWKICKWRFIVGNINFNLL